MPSLWPPHSKKSFSFSIGHIALKQFPAKEFILHLLLSIQRASSLPANNILTVRHDNNDNAIPIQGSPWDKTHIEPNSETPGPIYTSVFGSILSSYSKAIKPCSLQTYSPCKATNHWEQRYYRKEQAAKLPMAGYQAGYSIKKMVRQVLVVPRLFYFTMIILIWNIFKTSLFWYILSPATCCQRKSLFDIICEQSSSHSLWTG